VGSFDAAASGRGVQVAIEPALRGTTPSFGACIVALVESRIMERGERGAGLRHQLLLTGKISEPTGLEGLAGERRRCWLTRLTRPHIIGVRAGWD
jgi:hypothetical protein